MAKLHFYYASMNAGKSTILLQASFNYRERGMRTALFTAALNDRHAPGMVRSRIGLEAPAITFAADSDVFAMIAADLAVAPLDCVLVDEAQFLSRAQVLGLGRACDEMGVPVLCYGLRTDFRGELFEGSGATMNLRVDENGDAVTRGAQTEIGGNDRYVALCRRHHMARMRG